MSKISGRKTIEMDLQWIFANFAFVVFQHIFDIDGKSFFRRLRFLTYGG